MLLSRHGQIFRAIHMAVGSSACLEAEGQIKPQTRPTATAAVVNPPKLS